MNSARIHPSVREKQTSSPCTASEGFFDFLPAFRDVAASGAAGVLLPRYRGVAARRPALPKPTPWLVRLDSNRGGRISAAAARAAAALARLVAAAARRLHGGAVLRSSVPQQLAPHSELVSFLGRLLGKLAAGFHVFCVHGTHAVVATTIIAGNDLFPGFEHCCSLCRVRTVRVDTQMRLLYC